MPRSTCGACKKIFSSTGAFDNHRIGSYGDPVYAEKDFNKEPRKRKVIAWTAPTRRCMTTEEMLAHGFAVERKTINITREGRDYPEGHDIWYEPAAREAMERAYPKSRGNDTESAE